MELTDMTDEKPSKSEDRSIGNSLSSGHRKLGKEEHPKRKVSKIKK